MISEADGIALEIKASTMGARDLRAQLLHLAFAIRENPTIARAVLVTRLRNLRPERLLREMRMMAEVLQPDLADRLAVVALGDDETTAVAPHPDGLLDDLKQIARHAWAETDLMALEGAGVSRWTSKSFRIWLTLFDAWLREEDALPIGILAHRAGCSQPTVAAALERLAEYGEIQRTSNRGAKLKAFPQRSVNEILVLIDTLRPSTRFIDATGRAADPERLLRRLERFAPEHVALGGVTAARHYHPQFDLNGTPRVDLVIHGRRSHAWLERVDPALQPSKSRDDAPVLVLHTLEATTPGFDPPSTGGLPFAGPAETLLDLYDLRLVHQAEEFVAAIRERTR